MCLENLHRGELVHRNACAQFSSYLFSSNPFRPILKVRLGLDEIDWTKTGWTKSGSTIAMIVGRRGGGGRGGSGEVLLLVQTSS